MLWANVLDFHHGADQPEDLLRLVAERCYRPLLATLAAAPQANVTVNLDTRLVERLERGGFDDIIDGMASLADRRQVELTASAAGNTILTALDPQAMRHSIEEHDRTLRRVFAAEYWPKGLFPPEMCYSPAVGRVAAEMGLSWVLVDDTACQRLQPLLLQRCLHRVEGTEGLLAFLRDWNISTGLLYGGIETPQGLLDAIRQPEGRDGYLVTATPAEVYGYHHEGYERFLAGVFADRRIETTTVSGLSERFPHRVCPVSLKASSWSPWATLQY